MKLSKSLMKSAIALAVAAAFTAPAFAVVNLESSPTAIKYASEQTISGTAVLNRAVGGSDLETSVTLGATFAIDAVAYVRFDLSSGTFNTNPAAALVAPGSSVAIAQGGAGSSFVIFAISPASGTALMSSHVLLQAAVGGITVANQNPINISYRLFETLTNAVNSTLPLKTVSSAPFVVFSPLLTYTSTATVPAPVADVSAAAGAYTDFTTMGVKSLGRFTATVNSNVALQSGVYGTLTDALTNANSLTVTGDFTLSASIPGGFDGAASNRVYLKLNPACTVGPTVLSSPLSANSATFPNIPASWFTSGFSMCVVPQGAQPIQASSYTGALTLSPPAGFSAPSPAVALSPIVRNGAQVDIRSYVPVGVTGYTSYLRVINNGNVSAAFSGQWLYQDGTKSAVGTLGTIPAGGNMTWNSAQVEAALGAPTAIGNNRPRLRVTAPTSSMQAQSFLANPDGTISTMHSAD